MCLRATFRELLVISVFFVSAGASLILDDEIESFARYCPNTKFCTTPYLNKTVSTSATSCCQKCSCSPRCHEVGTCCPDIPNLENKELLYPCSDLSEFSNVRNVSFRVGTYFHVVDNCPNEDLASLYPGCYHPSDIEDFLFVSDLDDERIYRNKHCALCNGETEFVQWHLTVKECYDLPFMKFLSIRDRNNYVLENCIIYPTPPNRHTGLLSNCLKSQSIISTCKSLESVPVTKEASYTTLRQFCEKSRSTQNTIFFRKSIFGSVAYSNVFCFLCTRPTDKPSQNCHLNVFVNQFKASDLSFKAILEFSGNEKVYETKESLCKPTHVWDPVVGKCRRFHCPVNNIPVENKCIQVASYNEGVRFGFYFFANLPSELQLNGLSEELMQIIRERMKEHVSGSNCVFCSSRFIFQYNNTFDPSFYYEASLSSNGGCTVQTILNKVRHLLHNGPLEVEVNKEVTFNFNMVKSEVLDRQRHEFDFTNSHLIQSGVCVREKIKPVEDWMLLSCPHIKLLAHELDKLGLTNDVRAALTEAFVMARSDNSSVFLCVQEYYNFIGYSAAGQVVHYVPVYILLFQIIYTSEKYLL